MQVSSGRRAQEGTVREGGWGTGMGGEFRKFRTASLEKVLGRGTEALGYECGSGAMLPRFEPRLCVNLGQVIEHFCASASPSVKWG